MQGNTTHEKRIEVWIRSSAPGAGAARERTLNRARQLGQVAELTVEIGVWGRSLERVVPDDGTDPVPSRLGTVRDRIEDFSRWAGDAGRTIDPFFRSRRIESTILGEAYDVVRLPTVAVAEFDGDELTHVAPSRDRQSGRVVEAEERLAHLVGEHDAEATTIEEFDAGEVSPEPDLEYAGDREAERRRAGPAGDAAERDDVATPHLPDRST